MKSRKFDQFRGGVTLYAIAHNPRKIGLRAGYDRNSIRTNSYKILPSNARDSFPEFSFEISERNEEDSVRN
jgi:hypothetical protein